MNITIKISDEIAKQARHEAVDDGLSLSGWVSQLIRERLTRKSSTESLLDALGNDDLSDVDLDFPRNQSTTREQSFE